jgi:predicted RNase H-like HicB family nuclease
VHKGKHLGYYLSLDHPIELQHDPEQGGVFVFHPDLEGCMAEGGTEEEAIANLADSRELWLEARLASGFPVPEPHLSVVPPREAARRRAS